MDTKQKLVSRLGWVAAALLLRTRRKLREFLQKEGFAL